MNPLDFMSLSEVPGLLNPSEEEIEAADIEACPHRYNVVGKDDPRRETASCVFLNEIAGGDIGVDRRTCQVCRCHGEADIQTNAYLERQLVCLAWAHTIAPWAATEPAEPGDLELRIALENVKQIRGKQIARRFVDSLVYHQSVTPQKGAELLDTLGLSPGPEG